jgi:hypothetical protein
MSKSKKPAKLPRITTPAAPLKWGSISKPGLKFESETDYEYTAEVILTGEQAKVLTDQLTPLAEKSKADALAAAETGKDKKAIQACKLHIPIQPLLDDEGEPTGQYVLKARRDAQYTNRKTDEVVNVTIPVFDSAGKPLVGAKIGRDSEVRVAFDAKPFCMPATNRVGISARLAGVQVIKLVEFGGASADSLGFDAVEGGYTAPEGGGEEAPFDGGEKKDGANDGSDF